MQARNAKLQEEMKMLKQHTSPQGIGLADESVLVKRLVKEFPEDRIEHRTASSTLVKVGTCFTMSSLMRQTRVA